MFLLLLPPSDGHVNLTLLLDMAAGGHGDRIALGSRSGGITFAELRRRARVGAAMVREQAAGHLLFLGRNGPALPQALFAAAAAGVPFTPLNYRLPPERLDALVGRFARPLVVVDGDYEGMLAPGPVRCTTAELIDLISSPGNGVQADPEGEAAAVLLFTSGTTSEPKIVSLSHENLASYILEAVEFGSAAPDDCALTATPPYHIAAIASVLSNLYAGRRVAYLADFDAAQWLRLVRDEQVTSAMVVPTMLSRIVDHLDGRTADAPRLRLLSYGGSRAAPSLVEAAMAAFPGTGFVNAYGLTETSSTVALLGPEDHLRALSSDDPAVRSRLSSVGRPVPGIEIEVRRPDGSPVAAGEAGELWLRGAQVSASYVGSGAVLDADGWFRTRDGAHIDAEGYLFIEGRIDDTIIRGGENIAPSEVEDVLRRHPAVADVAVVGVRDEQWGEQIVAAVVRRGDWATSAAELRDWARRHLRGSRTPDRICWLEELPYSPTGKLIRREVAAELVGTELVGTELAGTELAAPLRTH